MVKVIGGFRQSGKTTRLVQLASRRGGFIVVENKMKANYLKRELQAEQKYNVSVLKLPHLKEGDSSRALP